MIYWRGGTYDEPAIAGESFKISSLIARQVQKNIDDTIEALKKKTTTD